MMIKVIDIDNKYRESKRRGKRCPNLACAKVSGFYALLRGDVVGFDIPNPDKTYISCVFTKNSDYAWKEYEIAKEGTGEVYIGGSGVSLTWELPKEIEFAKPDYNLYPYQEYSFGFSSRGCDRKCGFCIVHQKEGPFRRNQHIKEFHDFRFKSCKLFDNNILCDPDWFFEQTNWAIDNKVQLDMTQGFDIRKLTDEIAAQMKRTKFVDQQIRFAWDIPPFGATEDQIVNGIEILRDHKINIRRNVSFYVLVGADWDGQKIIEIPYAARDLYRVHKLRSLGAMAFVQKFHEHDKMLNHLARYSNKRELYRSCTFSEYLQEKAGASPHDPAATMEN